MLWKHVFDLCRHIFPPHAADMPKSHSQEMRKSHEAKLPPPPSIVPLQYYVVGLGFICGLVLVLLSITRR